VNDWDINPDLDMKNVKKFFNFFENE